jgi:serine/threonine-protein kinase
VLPETLGEFAIEGLLGEGGSSLVYAATKAGRPIALKVLHPDLGLSDRERDRFLAEAETMRSVRHPGIVELVESGVLPDGRPFIAMPRLRGRSLASRLASGPLAPREAVALFDGVAEAVAALHRAGLIHRDIKPENVLWLGDEDRLVLLDLGIARDAEGAPSTTTRAGLARGTPQYMAPERLFGQRASVRTDVYELTLLLYAMLAARLPWRDDDPEGRLRPEVPAELRAQLPEALVTTLLDGLALDPARRPGTVDELARRVRELGASMPHAAPADPGAERTRLVVTPRGGPVDSSLAIAPTELSSAPRLAAGESGAQPTPRGVVVSVAAEAHPTLRSAAEERSRRSRVLPVVIGVGALGLGALVAIGVGLRSRHPTERAPSAVDTSTPRPSASSSSARPEPEVAPSGASIEPAPAPSPGPSASSAPTSSARSPSPSPRPSEVVSPSPSAPPAPTITPASSTQGGAGPAPASCTALIQLFCAPGSAGTPEECAAWKANVASWRAKQPADVTEATCKAALDTSRAGLLARKNTKIPR